MKRLERPGAAAVALAAAILFACLAHAVAFVPAAGFDLAVRGAVHACASPRLTYAMRGVTMMGAPAILVPLGILLVWRLAAAGRRRAGFLLAMAAVGGEAWDEGLKLLFHRVRPEAFFGLAQPENYSFPSGHSMESACFYGALAMVAAAHTRSRARRAVVWAAAAVAIGGIGLSRIYLGVHYPTDVVGGYLAGAAWLGTLAAVLRPD